MNANQLKQNIGQRMQLRPQVLLVQRQLIHLFGDSEVTALSSGEPVRKLPAIPTIYEWTIESVGDDNRVTLHCSFTGHRVTLGADNIKEYRTPGFLFLKCQLTLDGDKVRMEPLP